MRSRPACRVLVVALAIVAAGCATTKFKKDPGSHDHGFRYYRPKPFLLLQPIEGSEDPTKMKIELKWLPDFSEQYSIQIMAGVGTNHTTVELENGWNIKSTNVTVDSKASDFLNAIAGLLGATPKLLAPLPSGVEKNFQTYRSATVDAHEVPIGLYEAVIGPGPDGRKRLYAWRYVGFAPFAGCPVDPSGLEVTTCDQTDLYGLINVDGTLYFRRLSDLAANPNSLEPTTKAATKENKP